MTYNGESFDVTIEVGLNTDTRQVYAKFQSINPLTSLPPSVLSGFLPPEDGSGRGKGRIDYTILPKTSLATGTAIRTVAVITFDNETPIATNQVSETDPSQGTDPNKEALVTLDAGVPTSNVSPLPATETTTNFTVHWSGQDNANGSGIATYDISVSDNGGAVKPWLTATSQTSATYTGQVGHTYGFYSVATDNVGNRQPTPTTAQASTQVNYSWLSHQGSTLIVQGTSGNDVFTFQAGATETITFNGSSYTVDPRLYTAIQFYGNGGKDSATLTGSGNDFAVLLPMAGQLNGTGYVVNVAQCANVTVFSSGGNSLANFATSAGPDSYIGTPTYSAVQGDTYANYAVGFAHAHGFAEGSHNTAYLVTSTGADELGGVPTYSFVSGATYDSYAIGFAQVDGYTGGTASRAYLGMTTGNDTFFGLPSYSAVTGAAYAIYVVGFAFVAGYSGGPNATAIMATGSGPDTYVGTPNYSEVTGASYLVYGLGFARVNAYAGGSRSVAYLVTSGTSAAMFVGSSVNSQASGTGYSNTAWSFANVSARAGSTNSVADFYDSSGNDTFTGLGTSAVETGMGYDVQGIGFGSVRIHSTKGGTDHIFQEALDYIFAKDGNWQ